MGAIGGFYGAKLAHAGKEVHFLSHSDYQYVKERGLQVDSCDGSFHLPQINAYGAASDMPKCDVVLIGLKTVNNHLLPELLPPLLKEDTLVVLIQNGIGVEEDVQKIFPEVQLAAGLAFICSAKTEPGRVNHQCYGYINIGNYSCKQQEKIDEVVDDFRKAGVDANEVEYLEARWKKAVWNMPFNGMTVALNTQTDILLQHPSTLQLIKDQMMEVIEAAQACGGQEHRRVVCREDDLQHRPHDALLAQHETGLRFQASDGDQLHLHSSHREGKGSGLSDEEAGDVGAGTEISGEQEVREEK